MLGGRKLDQLCRTCLGAGRLLPIFGPTDYSQLITTYSGVQVSQADGYPQQMCFACLQLVKSAAFFCKIAVQSDEKLHRLLPRGAEFKDDLQQIKTEDADQSDTDKTYQAVKSETTIDSDDNHSADDFDSDSSSNDSLDDEIPTRRTRAKAQSLTATHTVQSPAAERLLAKARSRLTLLAKRRSVLMSRASRKDDAAPKIINRGDMEWRTRVRAIFRINGPSQARSYECRLCGIRLKQSSSMHVHAQKHLGYRVICESCGKGFPNNCALQQHNMNHHGLKKTFACSHCPFTSAVKYELTVHERTHTGERPFVCDTCGSSFYRRRCLIIHTRSHSETRPFKCTNCDKRFISRGEMMSHHNAVHQRRFVFPCPVCGHTYARRTTVYKHIAAQHDVPVDRKAVTKIML